MQRWRRPTPGRKKVGSVVDKEVVEVEGGAFSYWLQLKRMTLKRSEREVSVGRWASYLVYEADQVAQAWRSVT